MKVDDYQYGFDGMTRDRMIHKMTQGWKSAETPCGRGSELAHAQIILDWLPRVCQQREVTVLRDAGAGDKNWIRKINWQALGVYYWGYDLVPRAPDVQEFDVTTMVLDPCDAILCRHVLNHLSCALAIRAMDNFVDSGSKYLLLTNCDNQITYWKACGAELGTPLETFNDATKWWVELHELQSEQLWKQRPAN